MLVQPSKAEAPIEVMLLLGDKAMLAMLLQPAKAPLGILVTLSPMLKLVRLGQVEKLLLPIDVQLTALKFKVVKLVQLENAWLLMQVTLSPMVKVVRLGLLEKLLLPMVQLAAL